MNALARMRAELPDSQGVDSITVMFARCPHALEVMSPVEEKDVVEVLFSLPHHKKWWLEELAQDPRVIGALTVRLAWYRGLASQTSRPGEGAERGGAPPCGSDCPTCPHYAGRCQGCPDSKFYRPGEL